MSTALPGGQVDWHALAPFAVLAGTLVVAAGALPPQRRGDAARRRPRRGPAPVGSASVGVAFAGLTAAAAIFVSLVVTGDTRRFFAGRVLVGRTAAVVGLVVVVAALVALAVAVRRGGVRRAAEQVVGLVAAAAGLAALAAARDAALCVVALELATTGGVLAARAATAPAATAPAATAPADGGAAAARAGRAQLAGAVALAGEAYAVGVAAVITGTTRLAPLARGHGAAGAVAVCVLAVALAARAGSALWALAPVAAGRLRRPFPSGSRPVG